MNIWLVGIAVAYVVAAAALVLKIDEPKVRIIHAITHCAIAAIYFVLAFHGHA